MLGSSSGSAQDSAISQDAVQFNLPQNAPLSMRGITMGNSRATARGGALSLDLHIAVTLQNASGNRIHGVMLRVVTQEVVPGGKGSVTYPTLNVGPGENLPVRIDMQLMRPTQVANGPLVQVDLDGVLFQDLTFFGPDLLNSRRTLTACEMEARRDRDHFKQVLAQSGRNGLQSEILQSLDRQAQTQLAVTIRRAGRAVTAASAPEHTAEFAFLRFPDSPIEPVKGFAQIAGNEASAPRVEVMNRSNQAVKYVEMGWIVSDAAGHQYMAGSLPSAEHDLLPPSKSGKLLQETTLSFSVKGQPVSVHNMTGFVSQVEFADGKIWVPNRESLQNSALLKVLPPSAEEQRLTDIYRKRGMDALIGELNRF
jgi:hypothetical protein